MKECALPEKDQVCATICTRPLPAFHPLVSAENMCFNAANANAQREGLSGVVKASFLIEQALNRKDTRILDISERILCTEKLSVSQRYKAGIYEAYLPLYDAQVEDRYPTEEEMMFAFNGIHTVLSDSSQLLHSEEFMEDKRRKSPRTQIMGTAGEGLVLYLSLYNALNNGGTLLYPSSLREDNVEVSGPQSPYKVYSHDSHTYTPDNPNERKILGIVSGKNRSRHKMLASPIRILRLGSSVYHDLLRSEGENFTERLELEQIIYLVLGAEEVLDPHVAEDELNEATNQRNFCRVFRNRLGAQLEEKIAEAEPVPSTYQ